MVLGDKLAPPCAGLRAYTAIGSSRFVTDVWQPQYQHVGFGRTAHAG